MRVYVVWAPRARRARRRPLAKASVSHEVFLEVLRDMTDTLSCTRSPSRRYEALVHCAHRAARVARRSVLQHAADDHRLLAEAALRLYVAPRDGHEGDVQDLNEVVPRLLRYRSTDDGGWDHKALFRMHRLRLEESMCHDMAVLERSKMPERHKASARGQLRRQHAAVRAVRRRVEMDALYDDDGVALTTAGSAGAALSAYWSPVFNCEYRENSNMQQFLDYVQPVGESFQWTWVRGRTRAFAKVAHDSALGKDGLPYMF